MGTQTRRLVDSLKRALKAAGITYRDVAAALSLSESRVKRLFADADFSLDRLETICALADISLSDLIRGAAADDDRPVRLSLDQEKALADDGVLLTVFYLVLAGWTQEDLMANYEVDEIFLTRQFAALDRLGLIDLLPGNRVRLKTATAIDWRDDGPVRRAYERAALSEFLSADFESESGVRRTLTGELSAQSAAMIARKLDQVRETFVELVKVDRHLPVEERRGMGVLLAMRPFVFSVLKSRHKPD